MPANHEDILKNIKTILLVDWPNTDVPKSLLNAGFIVFSYSPDEYTVISQTDGGKLVFSKLDEQPTSVDLVNVYRPEAEHAAIIDKHVLALNAKVLWLHPPVVSANTAVIAAEHGIVFVE